MTQTPDATPELSTDDLVTALKAAAEPTRLRILLLLASGELNVKDLTLILGQSQPRISRHLKLLSEAGLVERSTLMTYEIIEFEPTPPGTRLIVSETLLAPRFSPSRSDAIE